MPVAEYTWKEHMSVTELIPLASTTEACARSGRFLTPDKSIHDCKIRNFTLTGAVLTDCKTVADNTPITLYVDGIGRFKATVTGSFDSEMEIRFDLSRCKPKALKSLFAKDDEAQSAADRRRHTRTKPQTIAKVLSLPDGQTMECEVADVSLSGALVKLDICLPIGAIVQIDGCPARVVDRREDGLVLRFADELDVATMSQLTR